MKKGFVLQSLICLLAVSCSVHEMETINPVTAEDNVFYASLESYSTPDTKVYVDNDNTVDGKLMVFWDAKDQISIFNETTLNQKYQFLGETGTNSGYFEKVSVETGGNPVDRIYAVYPYQESTSLDASGVLTLTLPAKQDYKEKSFGPGANTMVSVTRSIVDDNLLRFKNVCGYLVFKFYGGEQDNELKIKSIKLEGRNGELLSGEATMTPYIGEDLDIMMSSTAGKSITLDCNKVKLEMDELNPSVFWMVIPPTRFSQGFTVTVTDKDKRVFTVETDDDLTIKRNHVSTMSAVKVSFDQPVSE